MLKIDTWTGQDIMITFSACIEDLAFDDYREKDEVWIKTVKYKTL